MNRLFAGHLGVVAALAMFFAPADGFAKSKDKKKDPEAIGDRDVSKGVNFYSLEKEIAVGKQYAQELERQARVIDDPVIAEYVNRV
ncbi:MAG TPA: peptidase M48, partial [Bryobacteraceae bacterium]|nr:peptidase M48 [Bryobacteraceae bacterium]